MATTGLLLIDIQNDYFPGGPMELEGAEIAAIRAADLLGYFRSQAWPIAHVQHISLRPGSTFFLPDTEGALIRPEVEPIVAEPVFVKHYPNSFRETGLHKWLQDHHIVELVIAGMMTHMCVDASTRAAFDLGYSCTVISDACATRRLSFQGREIPAQDVQGTILAALQGTYADVLDSAVYLTRR